MFEWLKKLFRIRKEQPKVLAVTEQVAPARPAEATFAQRSKPKLVKTVTVGVDFGTSSTKVIVSGVVPERHHLLTLGQKVAGCPDFAMPSAIQISEGRLYFGSSAEQDRPDSQTFRSFKICLACEYGLAPCRGCAHRVSDQHRGQFNISVDGQDVVVRAHQLATWYLAYIFRLARNELEERWGQSFQFRTLFNVGAPIDQHTQAVGGEIFNKAAFWAEKMANSVWDGRPVKTLIEVYESISKTYSCLPTEEERPTFVQPETAAGLMAFVTSPTAFPGLYGIFDVGAGTTDVSFFRLADSERDQPRIMAFYDAETAVVGADEVDRVIAELAICRLASVNASSIPHESLLLACKRAKETLGQHSSVTVSLDSTSVVLSRQEIEEAASDEVKKMVSTYVQTAHRSYRKEPYVNRWATYTLFSLGGGARLPMVEHRLQQTRPSDYNRNIRHRRMTAPVNLEAPADAKANFDLLAVAYGLSFPPVDFPKIFEPSDVEPLRVSLPKHSRPDRDELYPK